MIEASSIDVRSEPITMKVVSVLEDMALVELVDEAGARSRHWLHVGDSMEFNCTVRIARPTLRLHRLPPNARGFLSVWWERLSS